MQILALLLLLSVGLCQGKMLERPSPTSDPDGQDVQTKKDATYWVTFSNKVRPGLPFKCSVKVFKKTDESIPEQVSILITLKNQKGVEVLRSPMQKIMTGSDAQLISIDIPVDITKPMDNDHYYGSYILEVTGKGSTVEFFAKGYVASEHKSFSVFVQTDKAIYKPTQTVSFRTFAMTPDLKAMPDSRQDIVVVDPKGNKIKQYKNVTATDTMGVVQKSFKLADNVPTGLWEIVVSMLGVEEVKKFTVDDYVLPRYEVKIGGPKFAVVTDLGVKFSVNAKYTFGKPVPNGDVSVSITANAYFDMARREESSKQLERPSISFEGKLNSDGEFEFEIPTGQFKELLKKYNSWTKLTYGSFRIQANVTEVNTGEIQSASHNINFYSSPAVVKFLDITPKVFKPGLKFTGYLEVRKRDETLFLPEDAKNITIVFNITYEAIVKPDDLDDLTQDTQSSSSALLSSPTAESSAAASIPAPAQAGDSLMDIGDIPFDGHSPTFQRQITKVMPMTPEERYQTLPDSGWIVLNFEVPADAISMSINAYTKASFATTNGYLYVQRADSPSGSYIQLKVDAKQPKIGDMVTVQAHSTQAMNALNYQIYSKGMLIETGIAEPTPTDRKKTTFNFNVLASMTPSFKIFAFYVVEENGEIVADALSLSADGLFASSVTVEFNKAKVKPKEKVEITVKAETGSIVFVLAVDKSVKLLKSGNDVTQDLVRQELVSYDYGGFFPMWRYMFVCGWPSYYGGVDAYSVFQSANVEILTDALLHRKPYKGPMFDQEAVSADSGGVTATQKRPGGSTSVSEDSVRDFFPERWLWTYKMVVAGSNGEVKIDVTAPDTITSWIATVFAFHPTNGLSVAAEPAVLTTFQDLFVNLDLPSSIIRKEAFCFTASLFSYFPDTLEVLLALEENDAFYTIFVLKKNHSAVINKENLGYIRAFGEVEEGDIEAAMYCFASRELGDLPIRVSAITNVQGIEDVVERTIKVKPEGVPRSTTKPYLVDIVNGSWTETVDVSFPKTAVEGSQTITVNIAGNLIGSIFDNMEDLLKMPYGCGEQNMINFSPIMSLLKFFFSTNTLTAEIEEKAKQYIEIGYQKELGYEHDNTGAFSAFGNRKTKESPSMWLTAFVMKCFSQAELLDKKYKSIADIDIAVIARSVFWIVRQQLTTGAFPEHGKVFNKRLQGGSGNGEALTAYVVIALHEASQVFKNDPALEKIYLQAKSGIMRGVQFLETNLGQLRDPYDICISAYALNLVGSKSKDQAFNLMQKIAQTGGGMIFWERTATNQEEPMYKWNTGSKAISVEMTAYALLTYSVRDMVNSAFPIVRWISKQRGPNGGFMSTQATVICIEALVPIASVLFQAEFEPMTVSVTTEEANGDQSTRDFSVNRDNEMLLQSWYMTQESSVINKIFLSAKTASGKDKTTTVLVDVIMNYNMVEATKPTIYNMTGSVRNKENGFVLYVAIWITSGEAAGMTILEVAIPAGYSPDLESIKRSASMTEVKEDMLNVYFNTDMIDSRGIKMAIPMIQTGGVLTESVPHPYRVYSYYEPAEELTREYVLEGAKKDFCTKVPSFGICPFLDADTSVMQD